MTDLVLLSRDGDLPPGFRRKVLRHAAFCGRCGASLPGPDIADETIASIRDTEPVLEKPEDLLDEIMKEVEEERSGETADDPLRTLEAITVAVAGAILAAFFFVHAFDALTIASLEKRLSGSQGVAQHPSAAFDAEQLLASMDLAVALTDPGTARMTVASIWRSNSGLPFRHLAPVASERRTEMELLQDRYPGLWSVCIGDGLDARERKTLRDLGPLFLRDAKALLDVGGRNHDR